VEKRLEDGISIALDTILIGEATLLVELWRVPRAGDFWKRLHHGQQGEIKPPSGNEGRTYLLEEGGRNMEPELISYGGCCCRYELDVNLQRLTGPKARREGDLIGRDEGGGVEESGEVAERLETLRRGLQDSIIVGEIGSLQRAFDGAADGRAGEEFDW